MLSSIEGTFPPIQTKTCCTLHCGRPALLGLPSFPGYCTSVQHSRLQAPIHKNLVLICVSVHGGHVTFQFFYFSCLKGIPKDATLTGASISCFEMLFELIF
jgi:hypothetical protein